MADTIIPAEHGWWVVDDEKAPNEIIWIRVIAWQICIDDEYRCDVWGITTSGCLFVDQGHISFAYDAERDGDFVVVQDGVEDEDAIQALLARCVLAKN